MEEVVKYYNDLVGLFTNASNDLNILGKIIKVALIYILTKGAIKVMSVLIENFFKGQIKLGKKMEGTYGNVNYKIEERKLKTVEVILKSVSRYFIYFVAAVTILDTVGVDTTSVLAVSGIGGLAVAFGMQNLVKDIVTGFFILLEDQFNVGDHILTGGFEGIVEEIGMRATKIRAFSGELHILPNGNIQTVTNKSSGAMRSWIDISIAYEEDIDKAIKVLNEVCAEVKKDIVDIVDGPEVLGVTSLGASDVVISVIAKSKPLSQWSVEREIRKRSKMALDQANIEIPYQKMVLIKE